MTPGAQERLRFWFSNTVMAMMALQKVAPNGDYSELVVIIADMRDEIARVITEAAGISQNVDVAAHEAKIEKKGEIPTAVLVLEVDIASAIFATVEHPVIVKGLRQKPPAGHVRAIVISSGAAMLLHPPVTSVPSAGQS